MPTLASSSSHTSNHIRQNLSTSLDVCDIAEELLAFGRKVDPTKVSQLKDLCHMLNGMTDVFDIDLQPEMISDELAPYPVPELCRSYNMKVVGNGASAVSPNSRSCMDVHESADFEGLPPTFIEELD
jgi:hypothetical protein